jgi:MYXO-CTERM domain-containing protein
MRNLLCAFGLLAAVPLAANAAVIYSSDFEANDGGWEATADWDPVGDWEWTDSYDFNNYGGAYNPPPNAYSGTGLWGTVVNGDYTNAGGSSFLSQTFDLTGYTDVEMSFANWAEVFYSFDTAELYINGDLVYERDTSDAPTDWEIITIDMSAYDNMAGVEVVFELYASTVVERAGWYIDDVSITGVPSPGALALLGLGGLVARRRRR